MQILAISRIPAKVSTFINIYIKSSTEEERALHACAVHAYPQLKHFSTLHALVISLTGMSTLKGQYFSGHLSTETVLP